MSMRWRQWSGLNRSSRSSAMQITKGTVCSFIGFAQCRTKRFGGLGRRKIHRSIRRVHAIVEDDEGEFVWGHDDCATPNMM
jgi:hypothetical protein